jgi:uncharacterized protein YyaL (SSP411 family)
VVLLNLLRLSRLTGRAELEEKADNLIDAFSNTVKRNPHAYTMFLCGLDFALGPSQEVVLTGEKREQVKDLYEAIWKRYLPNTVVLLQNEETVKLSDYSMEMRPLKGLGTAYVCSNYVCEMPTTDRDTMLSLIK